MDLNGNQFPLKDEGMLLVNLQPGDDWVLYVADSSAGRDQLSLVAKMHLAEDNAELHGRKFASHKAALPSQTAPERLP